MVAELSDFRIFGFPDVFCRLLTYLPGSFGFSDFPRFFAECCHGCPDLSEFYNFPTCFCKLLPWLPGYFGILGFPEFLCRFRDWLVGPRFFRNSRISRGFLQIPVLGGRSPAISINWWKLPHGCRAFGFSNFRIPRLFFQVAGIIARIFRIFGFPDVCCRLLPWLPGSFRIVGLSYVLCRFRDWLVSVLPFPSIGGGRPMIAELSDFRIFGSPEVLCRLVAWLPGSSASFGFPVFSEDPGLLGWSLAISINWWGT